MQYRIMEEGSSRNKVLVPIENISDFFEKTKVMFFQAPLNPRADTWAVTSNQVFSLSTGFMALIPLIGVFLTWEFGSGKYGKL